MIKTKEIRKKIRILDDLILEYKTLKEPTKRDYKSYEEKLFMRTKKALLFFEDYIKKAIIPLTFVNDVKSGRPEKLSLEQKVKILLIQRLIGKSNREMSFLLMLFSTLTNVDISYKTIERIYSDEKVVMVLSNIHNIIISEKKLEISNSCGDGTGYVLSIKDHYASIASKLKDKKSTKKKKILFSFTLMDVEKRIYIAFGTSFKSEKEAFNKAKSMLDEHKIELDSIRLDRYYSGKTLVNNFSNQFNGIKIYLIPKKNATVGKGTGWNTMLKDFVENTYKYFEEYYKRNQSESGFSEDKRRFGWKIPQKLENRINTAYFGIFTWHNLFWVGTD